MWNTSKEVTYFIRHFGDALIFLIIFRATLNKKLRDNITLELSFVNSNIQVLKEELADVNSSVDIYCGSW